MKCGNCEIGFRRVNGIHIGSQRLGMIPDEHCEAIEAVRFGSGDEHEKYLGGPRKQWGVRVDGELLRTKAGVGRAWTTEAAALRAGRKPVRRGPARHRAVVPCAEVDRACGDGARRGGVRRTVRACPDRVIRIESGWAARV